ncbi:hypothetical protein ACOMHN_065733 [Nucella lapillus]
MSRGLRDLHMQYVLTITDRSAEASRPFGLTVRLSLHQSTPGTTAAPPRVTTDNTQLKTVDCFKDIVSVIFADVHLDKEIATPVSRADGRDGQVDKATDF